MYNVQAPTLENCAKAGEGLTQANFLNTQHLTIWGTHFGYRASIAIDRLHVRIASLHAMMVFALEEHVLSHEASMLRELLSARRKHSLLPNCTSAAFHQRSFQR